MFGETTRAGRNKVPLIGLLLLALFSPAAAITVTGICTNPTPSQASTAIRFLPQSAPEDTVTAYTDNQGQFTVEVEPGIYDIEYWRPPFTPVRSLGVPLTHPTVLVDEELTYDAVLPAELSGEIGPGLLFSEDGFLVPDEDELIILPGTTIWFEDGTLLAQGSLQAVGTASQPIVFSGVPWENFGWEGIDIISWAEWSESVLEHCEITGSSDVGIEVSSGDLVFVTVDNCWVHDCLGNGIHASTAYSEAIRVIGTTVEDVTGAGIVASASGSYGLAMEDCTNNIVRKCGGDGIRVMNDWPIVGCTVTDCGGDGIVTLHPLESCHIEGNGGDGYRFWTNWMYPASGGASNCTIVDNGGWGIEAMGDDAVASNLTIENTLVAGNGLGGVTAEKAEIYNSRILNNDGIGLHVWTVIGHSDVVLDHVVIAGNTASEPALWGDGAGAGIVAVRYDFDLNILLNHSIIAFNTLNNFEHGPDAGGISTYDTPPGQVTVSATNTIITQNSSADGHQVSMQGGGNAEWLDLDHSLLHGSAPGEAVWIEDDDWDGGELVQTNANGDSCDVYFNLYDDPQLVYPADSTNFAVYEGSPCIGAGTEGGDIGLGEVLSASHPDVPNPIFLRAASTSPHVETGLGAPSPNPFNARTVLPFTLETRAHVQVAVYDLLGREVARLADREFGPGEHRLSWDGRGHTSGVYLIRAELPGREPLARQVVLVK